MHARLAISITLVAVSAAHADPLAVSTDGVALVEGTANAALDVPVARHVAIRAALGYDFASGYDVAMGWDYQGGPLAAVTARVFWTRALAGPFVDFGVQVRRFSVEDTLYDSHDVHPAVYHDHYRAWSPRVAVGYELALASGLHLAAAVGVADEFTSREDGDYSYDETQFIGSLRIGYAF